MMEAMEKQKQETKPNFVINKKDCAPAAAAGLDKVCSLLDQSELIALIIYLFIHLFIYYLLNSLQPFNSLDLKCQRLKNN